MKIASTWGHESEDTTDKNYTHFSLSAVNEFTFFFVPDAIQIEKYEITNDQISSENLFFSVSEVCLKK